MLRLRRGWLVGAVMLAAFLPRVFPAALAFPHHARSGAFEVWSEGPLDQASLDAITADAARRLATSPLYRAPETRKVFLTSGGWRWRWLALSLSGSFAFSPPWNGTIIVNASSITQNSVWNGRTIGGRRALAGILAHETCHEMERRQFGLVSDWTKPTWLREGYCDFVAQESSLSDADYQRLKASDPSHPALPYYEGRQRVAAALAANGGNVDALFAQN